MASAMQKLRALLPGQQSSSAAAAAAQRHSVVLEPEIGFQITIECNTQQQQPTSQSNGNGNEHLTKTTVPELNVHLIAARHLPTLFGFKIVQGYLIKVKLFPGSKRLDSSIQTNTWPKFNENFKFPLAPDIKSSMKHSSRRGSRSVNELITPEELFAGQFVVFTVYALLELPPASMNRFNKTYRSLRDKSSNFVQKVIETSTTTTTNGNAANHETNGNATSNDKSKSKYKENPRDPMPPLTISESRRNIGSVTCYLEPKLFKRSSRTGLYTTEELWLPIKDITVSKGPNNNNNNNLTNAPKGVVEITLEVKDLNDLSAPSTPSSGLSNGTPTSDMIMPPDFSTPLHVTTKPTATTTTTRTSVTTSPATINGNVNGIANIKWQRMTSEVKRKMGLSNGEAAVNNSANSANSSNINNNSNQEQPQTNAASASAVATVNAKASTTKPNLVLRITTSRMRCSNKVKDELESTAGSVYVKTAVFEHGIYVDAWKSPNFYPSLSTKWDIGNAATIDVPLPRLDCLDNMLIRTTLATKTKMGKKLVLGTVHVGGVAPASGTGLEQMQLLRESPFNERVAMWHCYQ